MSHFTADMVSTLEEFEALRPTWNGLVDEMEFPEIFYSWEWTYHYFQHYHPGDRLQIVLVRHSSGRLAGIAPLRVRETRRLGIRVRVLETIVTDIADYQNILVHPDFHRGRVVGAVLSHLRQIESTWDILDLSQLNSRDPTTFHVLNVAQAHMEWSVRSQMLTPVAVRNLRSGRMTEKKRQVRQIANRLETLQAEGYVVSIGNRDIDAWWPKFSSLHRHAWRESPLNTPHGRRFFEALIHAPGMRDKVELSSVEFEGRTVAMHFGFVDRRKVYYYMPAMDRSFRQERVGAVLLYAIVEHYRGNHEEIDFLRGMEEYKNWYTDDLDMNMRIVVYRTANFRAFMHNLRGALRRFAVDLGLPKAVAQILRRTWTRIQG
ncbi:MAG: GNAT family N-acetyltransferase [Proteobacteria bacterium]|nr:GNAT family N-acetyltransferase [Pseudomonadota bacterium]